MHGLGALLKQGWHPKRTILIASWDAEEEGLVGSTEWVEQNQARLAHAVAYFNTDVAVEGPDFSASAVPSLKEFVRDAARAVPSANNSSTTVYAVWQQHQNDPAAGNVFGQPKTRTTRPAAEATIGTLGSGSDYSPFLQHAGVPATDISSDGPYGVYHSAFDDYTWYTKFADPTFAYLQQQARVFGLEILRMADTDVLPYDYRTYGREVVGYVEAAQRKATALNIHLDFSGALSAATRFSAAGESIYVRQSAPPTDASSLNAALRAAEQAMLNPAGLPHHPWYKHVIFAPGEFTGYAAVVIPGVNEAIDDTSGAAPDLPRAQAQLNLLANALNHAAALLETAK